MKNIGIGLSGLALLASFGCNRDYEIGEGFQRTGRYADFWVTVQYSPEYERTMEMRDPSEKYYYDGTLRAYDKENRKGNLSFSMVPPYDFGNNRLWDYACTDSLEKVYAHVTGRD